MKFTIRHHMDADAGTFWRVFASQEYLDRAWAATGATDGSVLAREGDPPAAWSRRVRSMNPVNAPGPVKRLTGDRQTVVDDGAFDPDRGTWSFTITPGTLANKVRILGVIRLDEAGDGTVERVIDMDAAVRVFGIGGLFEKAIESEARQSNDRTAEVLNQLFS